MPDCVTNRYQLDHKTVVITLDDVDTDSVMVYLSYRTLTEVQETRTGKVDLMPKCLNLSQIFVLKIWVFYILISKSIQ